MASCPGLGLNWPIWCNIWNWERKISQKSLLRCGLLAELGICDIFNKHKTPFHFYFLLIFRRLITLQLTASCLFLEETVEDEDKHPLQCVEDGEEIRHHNGRIIKEEQAKGPREPQQTEQSKRAQHPRPAKQRISAKLGTLKIICRIWCSPLPDQYPVQTQISRLFWNEWLVQ